MPPDRPKLKRKYQVFISSTFSDLAEARQQATLAVVRAGHFPLNLEYTGPDPASKLDFIKDAIAECQYYVLILGHRYGSIGTGQQEGQERSYVEIELDEAERNHLNVLAFVMQRDKVTGLRNRLKRPTDATEIENDRQYWRLYDRLTDHLKGPFYRPFSKPEDIFLHLLVYLSTDHPNVKGYIPEPMAEDEANTLRISSSNEILKDTIQRLGQFKFVDPRLGIAKEKKLALARAFSQLHGEHLGDKWKRVFIESGSTLAYIAKELAPRLSKMVDGRSERKIMTNNALAYLYLWLCAGVLCHPDPEGPPDNKYGAMFGALTNRDRIPDYTQPPLAAYDPDAVELISVMSSSIFGESTHNSHSILLGAASALQLSDTVNIDDGGVVPAGLSECRGFHGGSYPNRLFKRCMYLSRIPTFIFMHDEKINARVTPGICHFLCDSVYTWDRFKIDHPTSLWIACDCATLPAVLEETKRWLTEGDWNIVTYGDYTTVPIVMATNGAFRAACKQIGVTLFEAHSRTCSGR